jgi:iron complex transport system substrate-binding protein
MLLFPSFLFASSGEHTVTIRYAKGFSVAPGNGYTLVKVNNPWPGAKVSFCYILKEKGNSTSDDLADKYENCQVVAVPVERLVALSSTHLAFLDALNLVDRLVGFSSPQRIFTPSVRQANEQGQITGVGIGSSLRVESVLELAPDLILTFGIGSFRDAHPKLIEAGLKVAITGGYMESHPLGRAEWIKFMALFFAREEEAEKLFSEIEARYLKLAKLTAAVENRPTVLGNTPFNGRWHVAKGGSYLGQYFYDSGADYIWHDLRGTGSIPMDIEMVYERGMDAEYWLNNGIWTSLSQARRSVPRMLDLSALQTGKLYNRDKRVADNGANDYWESGVIKPDVVLADLIRIFHPQLLPDHELVYYRKLQ